MPKSLGYRCCQNEHAVWVCEHTIQKDTSQKLSRNLSRCMSLRYHTPPANALRSSYPCKGCIATKKKQSSRLLVSCLLWSQVSPCSFDQDRITRRPLEGLEFLGQIWQLAMLPSETSEKFAHCRPSISNSASQSGCRAAYHSLASIGCTSNTMRIDKRDMT